MAGLAVNLLFHVSFAIAFMIIPLVFAPILLSIMVSVGMFFMLTFATVGTGMFFVGTPFLAFALLAKMLLPFAVIAAGAAFVASRLLGYGDRVEDRLEDGGFETEVAVEDPFESFDRKLYDRDVFAKRSTDVTSWDLSDVVDELDFTGLGEYRQLFIEERIDGRTLLCLTEDDIKAEFGRTMPLGDRIRLSQLVSDLRRRSSRLP